MICENSESVKLQTNAATMRVIRQPEELETETYLGWKGQQWNHHQGIQQEQLAWEESPQEGREEARQ